MSAPRQERIEKKPILQEFKDLVKLWPYLREYKGLLTVAAVLVPFISVIEMNIPLTLKWSIDEGIAQSNWETLMHGATIYFALVLGQFFCRGAQTITTAYAVHRMIKSLRHALIKHVMRLSCRYHDRSLSGTLVTRATSDFDNLSESLNMGVLTSVIDIAVLSGAIIGLFRLNWQLALYALVILPFVALVVAWFSKVLKVAMLKARRKIADLNAFTQECLYGATTIKLLTAEPVAQKKFDHYNEEYRKAQMSSVILDSAMFSVIDGLTSITIGIVLYFALVNLGESGLTAGLMVAFVQYIQHMFEPLKHLGNKMAMLQGAFTSIDRIFGVLGQNDIIAGEKSLEKIRGKLEFRNVLFSYDQGETADKILKNVSFGLEPGQSLAIVGATGSGKSTITKLLTKLYDGYEGDVFIDDQELREIDGKSLRQSIAIVPQDIVLFNGNIAFNIGLNSTAISERDIKRAAESVGADKFIEKLPGKYGFKLEEHGANLSHGQRQLIAFARALAKNPSMVILDEATSSVDPDSEAMIQAGIESILSGRTVIVIAHRLSTIRKCNKILVVDRGEIVEQGSHDELLAANGAYYNLHHALA